MNSTMRSKDIKEVGSREKVLCILRDKLPPDWVQTKAATKMRLSDFAKGCTRGGFQFIRRDLAEKDPSLKQIIPYIVLQTIDGEKTAIYLRQGSEERLHNLWSLGLGGHINPIDRQARENAFDNILLSGMNRELEEELAQRPKTDTPRFIGIISEDLTEVGKVHLGAVFQIRTPVPSAYTAGPELTRFQWYPTRELSNLKLELWSEMALALICQD